MMALGTGDWKEFVMLLVSEPPEPALSVRRLETGDTPVSIPLTEALARDIRGWLSTLPNYPLAVAGEFSLEECLVPRAGIEVTIHKGDVRCILPAQYAQDAIRSLSWAIDCFETEKLDA